MRSRGLAKMKFEASTDGEDKFALTDALQWFADDFWLPDHVTPERGGSSPLVRTK